MQNITTATIAYVSKPPQNAVEAKNPSIIQFTGFSVQNEDAPLTYDGFLQAIGKSINIYHQINRESQVLDAFVVRPDTEKSFVERDNWMHENKRDDIEHMSVCFLIRDMEDKSFIYPKFYQFTKKKGEKLKDIDALLHTYEKKALDEIVAARPGNYSANEAYVFSPFLDGKTPKKWHIFNALLFEQEAKMMNEDNYKLFLTETHKDN